MSRKREIFNIIDRDCVSSVGGNEIKDYINTLLNEIKIIESKSISRKNHLKNFTKSNG